MRGVEGLLSIPDESPLDPVLLGPALLRRLGSRPGWEKRFYFAHGKNRESRLFGNDPRRVHAGMDRFPTELQFFGFCGHVRSRYRPFPVATHSAGHCRRD